MANDNLPAVAANEKPVASAELEMNDWLKKLKENQDRKKEGKLRKYNDIVSKFIIVMIAVCIVSFIAIAALAIENNNLYKQNDQLMLKNAQNETGLKVQITDLNAQITKLTNDNQELRSFIFSNRTFNNVEYSVNVDPSLPKVSKITFGNNKVHFEFIDGSSKDVFFIDNNMYVGGQ
jgi:hypothetical protein